MTIKSLADWQTSYEALELTTDQTWKDKIISWLEGNVNFIDSDNTGMTLTGTVTASNDTYIKYTLDKATFKSNLPDSTDENGNIVIPDMRSNLQAAYAAACVASTLEVPNLTLPSVINNITATPQAETMTGFLLSEMPLTPVEKASEAQIIETFRNSFLLQKWTISGIDASSNPVTIPNMGVS